MTARAVRPDQHATITGYAYGCRCDACRKVMADYRKAVPRRPARADEHGRLAGYQHGCRCESCRAAQKEYRHGLLARGLRPEQHGTLTGYGYGCRCERCVPVGRAYQRDKSRYDAPSRLDRLTVAEKIARRDAKAEQWAEWMASSVESIEDGPRDEWL